MMSAVVPKITPAAPAETTRRIADFVRGFSIEATRPTAADLEALKSALPAMAQVYLSAVPTRPLSDLVAFAADVRAAGLEPIPHLAARNLASADALDGLLARLSTEANVRRLLIIAGDSDRPQGPYTSAVEVIESGLLQRHGIAEAGIAGYPDGHPRISTDALDRALAAKIEAAEQTGLDIHIVTQFGFSAERMVSWIRRLRDQGFEHPVRIGMAGPTNLATLLRYARRCGVAASAQGLTRQAGLLKHLVGTSAPDGIIRPLADSVGELGKVAAHFFSFGGLGATARWAAAAAAGRIVLDRDKGFGVEPP
jgi:methylenetetrahydrofolate reductase (NADPH)